MDLYKSLEERSIWSTAIAQQNFFEVRDLWIPKFNITKNMKVMVLGAYIARGVGAVLVDRGFNWFVTERAPEQLNNECAETFNYGLFSVRTGEIGTVSLLKQWINWALKDCSSPDEIWENDGRFYDPFRPAIEPNGFESKEELLCSRNVTLDALREALVESDVFFFTLDSTESWVNLSTGCEHPYCPGMFTKGRGAEQFFFKNQDFSLVRSNLYQLIRRVRQVNPKIKFVFSISPQPLAATISTNHVLLATVESKSILRAALGSALREFPFVDYFPFYEIIASAPSRGVFFEPNLLGVNKIGVKFAMDNFFSSISKKLSKK